jgi:hypothetical protein
MGREIFLVFLGLALATSGCGGGGALSAAPEGGEVIVQTSFRNGAAIHALTAVGDGDALLVWPEGAGETVTLVARRFDRELDAYAEDLALEGPTASYSPRCALAGSRMRASLRPGATSSSAARSSTFAIPRAT